MRRHAYINDFYMDALHTHMQPHSSYPKSCKHMDAQSSEAMELESDRGIRRFAKVHEYDFHAFAPSAKCDMSMRRNASFNDFYMDALHTHKQPHSSDPNRCDHIAHIRNHVSTWTHNLLRPWNWNQTVVSEDLLQYINVISMHSHQLNCLLYTSPSPRDS